MLPFWLLLAGSCAIQTPGSSCAALRCGRRRTVGAPFQDHGAADVGQRPRRVQLELERAVDPERIGSGCLKQRTSRDADAEGLKLDFTMQFDAPRHLQRGPLHSYLGGQVGIQAGRKRAEAPRVLVAHPRPGDQALVTDDEVAVGLEEIEDPGPQALLVRGLPECEKPHPSGRVDIELRGPFDLQHHRDRVVGVDHHVEGLGIAVVDGQGIKVGVFGCRARTSEAGQ